MTEEIPLLGGRTTQGVVRVDETVRRPPRRNSVFVRALLEYLAERGFNGAPRFLGVDDLGRECFSYLEGIVPSDLALYDDATIAAAARLIRAFHDATIGFAPQAKVVCHNDLSPCNAVFLGANPTALIDFDAAAPGTRLWDLGYAAWLWLDIGSEEVSAEEQVRRLRLFSAAYDPEIDLEELVGAMIGRQSCLAAEDGDQTRAAWASACLAWTRDNLSA